MDNSIKKDLLQLCQDSLDVRLHSVTTIINDLKQSLQSETKSSAGDKHETGRAMVQLEREKAGKQLVEIQKTQLILSKITPEHKATSIGLGSIVKTTNANYFIAISAGALTYQNNAYYAISPSTPIGLLLMGKTVGNSVVFRGNNFEIVEVG